VRLLDQKLKEIAVFAKELVSDARVEISFEHFEDEDAHIRVHTPSSMNQDEVQRIELAVGRRCTEILLETGLFFVAAVYD
jgi:hypothetical protein